MLGFKLSTPLPKKSPGMRNFVYFFNFHEFLMNPDFFVVLIWFKRKLKLPKE